MFRSISDYLEKENCNRPASQKEIDTFLSKSGIQLPRDYIDFLKSTNGYEGGIGENSYAALWKVGDLLKRNKEYRCQEFAPGLFLFGSDGGGEAYGFDMTRKPWNIVQIPFIGMNREDMVVISTSFRKFLDYLYHQE